jgi:hypothetical protein
MYLLGNGVTKGRGGGRIILIMVCGTNDSKIKHYVSETKAYVKLCGSSFNE